jgi:hypothetical protein
LGGDKDLERLSLEVVAGPSEQEEQKPAAAQENPLFQVNRRDIGNEQ